jgi:hypothetical protein
MFTKKSVVRSFIAVFIILMISGPAAASPLSAPSGTGFTYQGKLLDGGVPANGTYDLQFKLFDALTNGNQVGSTLTQPSVPVTNGLFTVQLDFGNVFNGTALYLEIGVRPGGSSGAYTTLTPRQPLSPTPYALQAQQAVDSQTLGGHPASDFFMTASSYLGRHWGVLADTTGDVGEYSSITTGVDGLGLISYYDYDNGYLKVLHCGNLACTNGNIITSVDKNNVVGQYTSITIGADGLGLISYYDYTHHDLKVLHCGNVYCNSGNNTVSVDQTGDVGLASSITIGVDGLGLISYIDFTNSRLKVLHCGNLMCDTSNISTTVDLTSYAGEITTSITIGGDGLGLISYWGVPGYDLRVLHCGNLICNSGNTSTAVDTVGEVGGYSSITTGADGLGLVSYYDNTNHDLKVLHCGNPACSAFNISTSVDTSSNDVGIYNSITIGPDGLGLISYMDQTNKDLKVAHCGNLLCNSNNAIATVDAADDVGSYSSITIGSDGLALISNYDHTGGDLKVIKMSGLGRR